MIKRSEKVAFLGVGTNGNMKYMRMTDFTELSTSRTLKNTPENMLTKTKKEPV